MAALGPLIGAMNSPAFAAADDEIVRIGYLPITDATALLVAHGMGYFADEGLTAERPTLIRGWSPLVEGFVSGKFNLVHFLKPIPVWMRYNNNIPVKLMAWAHTNGSGLVVGGHTDITDFSQLGGKQVAVPFWYSMHNIVLQYALRQSGVKAVIKGEGEPLAADGESADQSLLVTSRRVLGLTEAAHNMTALEETGMQNEAVAAFASLFKASSGSADADNPDADYPYPPVAPPPPPPAMGALGGNCSRYDAAGNYLGGEQTTVLVLVGGSSVDLYNAKWQLCQFH